MTFSRDISIVVFLNYKRSLTYYPRVLDGLCGTGARGIRLAVESGPLELHLNDRDPRTAEIASRNVERAGIEATVTSLPFFKSMHYAPFDYIDIDPYGTPAPYIAPAIRGLKRRSLLGIAATDTAALVGNHPNATRRRYHVDSVPTRPDHEVGIRILVGSIARQCAVAEKGVRPILSYHKDHHYRVFLEVTNGAGRADESLDNIGYFSQTDSSFILDGSGTIGPLWTGPLCDPPFVDTMEVPSYLESCDEIQRLRPLWSNESRIGTHHHSSPLLGSSLNTDMTSMENILTTLSSLGYAVTRSSYDPQSFCTDAPEDDIKRVYVGKGGMGND